VNDVVDTSITENGQLYYKAYKHMYNKKAQLTQRQRATAVHV